MPSVSEPPPMEPPTQDPGSEERPKGRRLFVELLALWLGTLLLIRLVVAGQASLGLHEVVLALVPFLFVYAPVGICHLRGIDSYSYPLYLPAFRDLRAWRAALVEAGKTGAVILLPWLLGYHLYQSLLFGLSPGWNWPEEIWMLIPYHLFFVAIPEEFFYRGYIQTRLDEWSPPRWKFLGAELGHSLWISNLLFAFGHSLVVVRWWHFATFFPGLVFGWLRARTGGVLAGAFFHAACNVAVVLLDSLYGVGA